MFGRVGTMGTKSRTCNRGREPMCKKFEQGVGAKSVLAQENGALSALVLLLENRKIVPIVPKHPAQIEAT